ncbi:hypothetical protein V8C43DRAFT_189379 [Trichoderma afarasin]
MNMIPLRLVAIRAFLVFALFDSFIFGCKLGYIRDQCIKWSISLCFFFLFYFWFLNWLLLYAWQWLWDESCGRMSRLGGITVRVMSHRLFDNGIN